MTLINSIDQPKEPFSHVGLNTQLAELARIYWLAIHLTFHHNNTQHSHIEEHSFDR